MDDIYNGFMVHHLIDIALDLRQSKRLAPSSVPESAISRIDEHHFRVTSDANPPVTYDVVLDLGVCSCKRGVSGGLCEHQTACAHLAMVTLPPAFLRTSENRRWLMCVAVGEDKSPDLNFFSDFRARASPRIPQDLSTSSDQDLPTTSDTDTRAGRIVPAVPDSVRPLWDQDDSDADEPSVQSNPAKEIPRPDTQSNSANDAAQPPNHANTACQATEEASGTSSQASVPERQRPAANLVEKFFDQLKRTIELFGDGLTNEALQKATERVASITTSAQLNSWLSSAGSGMELARRGADECGGTWEDHHPSVDPLSLTEPSADPLAQPAKRRRYLDEGVATNGVNTGVSSSGHIGVRNFQVMR